MTTMTETQLSTSETPAAAQSALTGKRANWTIAHKIEGRLVKFAVKGAGELVLDVEKVHIANRQRAEMHGFVQRISDAAAMARDSKTGASATPQEKFSAMQRLVEHYMAGGEEWSPARSVDGVGRPKSENPQGRLLRMALKIFSPTKDEGVIAQFVKERNAAQITALLLSEQLKEAVELAREQLAEEDAKMAEGVDAEELLSGL
jgi:hypothetical protein